MQEAMKKPHTEDDIITLNLRVRRSIVGKVKQYVQLLEADDKPTYSVAEVFPEYMNKKPNIALRAYRTRENLTQKALSLKTGIPQHQISEMENCKRGIGKKRARKLAQALNVSDYRLFL
jgi:hypothetical protein